jgi:hypothetical protein
MFPIAAVHSGGRIGRPSGWNAAFSCGAGRGSLRLCRVAFPDGYGWVHLWGNYQGGRDLPRLRAGRPIARKEWAVLWAQRIAVEAGLFDRVAVQHLLLYLTRPGTGGETGYYWVADLAP